MLLYNKYNGKVQAMQAISAVASYTLLSDVYSPIKIYKMKKFIFSLLPMFILEYLGRMYGETIVLNKSKFIVFGKILISEGLIDTINVSKVTYFDPNGETIIRKDVKNIDLNFSDDGTELTIKVNRWKPF